MAAERSGSVSTPITVLQDEVHKRNEFIWCHMDEMLHIKRVALLQLLGAVCVCACGVCVCVCVECVWACVRGRVCVGHNNAGEYQVDILFRFNLLHFLEVD